MTFRAIHFREKHYFNLVLQLHFACIKSRIEKIHIDVLFSNTLNVSSVIEINISIQRACIVKEFVINDISNSIRSKFASIVYNVNSRQNIYIFICYLPVFPKIYDRRSARKNNVFFNTPFKYSFSKIFTSGLFLSFKVCSSHISNLFFQALICQILNITILIKDQVHL